MDTETQESLDDVPKAELLQGFSSHSQASNEAPPTGWRMVENINGPSVVLRLQSEPNRFKSTWVTLPTKTKKKEIPEPLSSPLVIYSHSKAVKEYILNVNPEGSQPRLVMSPLGTTGNVYLCFCFSQ